jgi:hypothetical protein
VFSFPLNFFRLSLGCKPAVAQRQRGVNHAEVRESLWKISERIACFRVDFLGKQIDIISVKQLGFENLPRLL